MSDVKLARKVSQYMSDRIIRLYNIGKLSPFAGYRTTTDKTISYNNKYFYTHPGYGAVQDKSNPNKTYFVNSSSDTTITIKLHHKQYTINFFPQPHITEYPKSATKLEIDEINNYLADYNPVLSAYSWMNQSEYKIVKNMFDTTTDILIRFKPDNLWYLSDYQKVAKQLYQYWKNHEAEINSADWWYKHFSSGFRPVTDKEVRKYLLNKQFIYISRPAEFMYSQEFDPNIQMSALISRINFDKRAMDSEN